MSSSVTATAPEEFQESFSFEPSTETNHATETLLADAEQGAEMNNMTAPQGSCLKLKGSLVPMTVLELNHFHAGQFSEELQAKIAQAPDFFENLPVVIDLGKYQETAPLPFEQLIAACEQRSIRVVAIRGGTESLQAQAKIAGLSVLAAQKERATEAVSQPEPAVAAPAETPAEPEPAPAPQGQRERQVSKVVHHPIRSGQQVYASDGDLIVLASVSAGAEILADGNIHVYGALRGRALAGVKGDTGARIFCHSLEAELVSVAGQYKISEDIDTQVAGKPTQVFLEGDNLRLREIDL